MGSWTDGDGVLMRLINIEFHGYKRLLETKCNVDAPLLALVGPNEAGKTSVLQALNWLTNSEPLPHDLISRGKHLTPSVAADPEEHGEVVAATYVLGAEDRELLAELDVEPGTVPTRLWVGKRIDAGRRYLFTPRPERRRVHGDAVAALLPKSSAATSDWEGLNPDDVKQVTSLATNHAEWSDANLATVKRLRAWLESAEHDDAGLNKRLTKTDADLAEALDVWIAQMRTDDPGAQCWEALENRIPKFLLFGAEDRELRDTYNLGRTSVSGGSHVRYVPHADVTSPDAGLENLLALGGTTMMDLHETAQLGDSNRIRMAERDCNELLAERLSPYWSQGDVAAEIKIEGQSLRVHIHEKRQVYGFTERSDGFRTFLTLIVFLARNATASPPILLIDEAETHLHYDAQADLIDYLRLLGVRTIYTTHSPGCLPPDMGTGVRVIRQTGEGISELSNNFWTGDQFGLSPLLFAMGAGVAALSRFRAAVFAEGPSDMILLPSLIRLATGHEGLPYQVVPGLSSLRAEQMGEAELAAVRVAYLVDGDAGGDELKQDLIDGGVQKAAIQQLKAGWATEDLVDPKLYLDTVNQVLVESGGEAEQLALTDVQAVTAQGVPISKAVSNLLGGKAPGKPLVAARLVEDPDQLKLAKGAIAVLKTLDRKFRSTLELTTDAPDRG